jgi:hypothetical protein
MCVQKYGSIVYLATIVKKFSYVCIVSSISAMPFTCLFDGTHGVTSNEGTSEGINSARSSSLLDNSVFKTLFNCSLRMLYLPIPRTQTETGSSRLCRFQKERLCGKECAFFNTGLSLLRKEGFLFFCGSFSTTFLQKPTPNMP